VIGMWVLAVLKRLLCKCFELKVLKCTQSIGEHQLLIFCHSVVLLYYWQKMEFGEVQGWLGNC